MISGGSCFWSATRSQKDSENANAQKIFKLPHLICWGPQNVLQMKRLKLVNKNMFFKTLQLIYCNCKFFLQDNAITHIAANTFLAKPNLTNVHLERNGLLALEMTSLMISISADRSKKLSLQIFKTFLILFMTSLRFLALYHLQKPMNDTFRQISSLIIKVFLKWEKRP